MKLFFRIIFKTVLILTILTGCATTDYNKAIELNPKFAMAYNNRGFTYFLKKDYEKAWDEGNALAMLSAAREVGKLCGFYCKEAFAPK